MKLEEPIKEREKKEIIVSTRGRIFKGKVIKKFQTRVVIEFERTVYLPKYERYHVKKTKLHARLPKNMDINVGDYVKIQECRPMSKIIHFIVLGRQDASLKSGRLEHAQEPKHKKEFLTKVNSEDKNVR